MVSVDVKPHVSFPYIAQTDQLVPCMMSDSISKGEDLFFLPRCRRTEFGNRTIKASERGRHQTRRVGHFLFDSLSVVSRPLSPLRQFGQKRAVHPQK